MKRTLEWTLLISGTAAMLLGCAPTTTNPVPAMIDVGEVVPAADSEDLPGMPLVARYWGEVNPMTGTLGLYEIHPGNVIFRNADSSMEAVKYSYTGTATQGACTTGATCVPPSGQVKLYTDPTQVQFTDSNSICYQNNATSCAHNFGGNCTLPGYYCAPLQLVSNLSTPLPNVVVRFISPMGGNSIVGCGDVNVTPGDSGQCAATGQSAKFNNASSTSLLQDSAAPGCGYCYGNANKVTSILGLKDVVYAGTDTTMRADNTDVVVMQLGNTKGLNFTIEVRYTAPSYATSNVLVARNYTGGVCDSTSPSTAQCVTAGTTCVTVAGGGFGPPDPCDDNLPGVPSSCPESLTTGVGPASGYEVHFKSSTDGAGQFSVVGTNVLWTDTTVRALVPSGQNAVSGQVRIVTPQGNIDTPANTTISMCPVPNSWRKLSPTSSFPSPGIVEPVAGVLGTGAAARLVVAGGRVSATDPTTAQVTTHLLTRPNLLTNLNPAWTTGNNMTTARSSAAFGVANGSLYAIGGIDSTGMCLSSAEKLTSATGSWASLANSLPDADVDGNPDQVCQATAVVVGTKIYVTGGTWGVPGGTQYYYLHSGDAGPVSVNGALGGRVTYILDTTTDTWTFDLEDGLLPNSDFDPSADRFESASVSNGSTAEVLGGIDSNTPSVINADTSVTSGPTFSALGVTGFSARHHGSAAYSTGATKFYYFGGSTSGTDANDAAVSTILNATPGTGSWATLTPTGDTPAVRAGHAFVRFTWTDNSEHIYAVGGQSSGGLVTDVDEYTP